MNLQGNIMSDTVINFGRLGITKSVKKVIWQFLISPKIISYKIEEENKFSNTISMEMHDCTYLDNEKDKQKNKMKTIAKLRNECWLFDFRISLKCIKTFI